MQRRARRSAQCEAEKGRASQKQRSDFLAAPVHMAPPGRQKSKREFCLFGGVFLRPARRAVCPGWPLFRSLPLSGLLAFVLGVSAFFLSVFRCLVPGLWVVRRFLFGLRCLLAVWPSSALFPACRQPAAFVQTFAPTALFARRALCVRSSVLFWLSVCLFYVVCTRIFLLSFAFSCLAVASQTSFHLSLRPRRASTFFRKESRQRFARGRGSAPFEPPCLRPAADLPLFLAAGRLSGPSGRKPPADKGNARKAKEQSSAFRAFLCVGDAPELFPARENRSSARARTRKEPRACAAQMQTQTRCASCPPQVRVRARRGEERDTVRDLPGAAALEKPRSRAQLFKRFCAKGDACALRLLTPFPRAAGRLKRPFGPQTAG